MTAVEAALAVARDNALAAIVTRHPAKVVLDEQTPKAGASMGSEGLAFDQAGHPEISQMASVVIVKSTFTGRPGRGKTIVIDGRGFTIETVSGDLEVDRHWLVRCKRAPGEDDA